MYYVYEVYYENKEEVQELIGIAKSEKDANHLLTKYWEYNFSLDPPKYWRGWNDHRGQWWDLGSWSSLFLITKNE